ncbi:pyridoxal phosphate-dependent transferase [Schizophyllum amplum]|uniref:Pyridoxal phosphate-dependent transferase n=1 Tax=Schizophyllum amplum TaxID=97359 RepID=A0A550CYW3_9AGAR|nr:pyridoxal phosphate-dependent transferase [Auriculariopsis ampla]
MALSFRVGRGILSTLSPPIPQAHEWANAYKATPARPLLNMSQGVPGIPPPPELQRALGAAAASQESFGYTVPEGDLSMRNALAAEMKHIYGNSCDVTSSDIALTTGCNLAFVASIMALTDAGDEVILPVPWYFNHQMTLSMLGLETVCLRTYPEDGFQPSIERCEKLITPKTRAIALVTPNNPTGSIYSAELLAQFVKLATDKGVALIIDETYRDFITSGEPPHALFASDAWRRTVVHCYSFSKAYCIPGHRLGAIVAAPEFLTHVKTVLDTVQICPPRVVQLALGPLLPSLRDFVAETARAVEHRHVLFRNALPPSWRLGAQGGYYAFVRHPFKHVAAFDVCKRLATEMGVVTLPSAFFCEQKVGGEVKEVTVEEEDKWIRFSVANINDEKVQKVCERLKESETALGWELEG